MSIQTEKSASSFNPCIQGLRGIAALSVFFFHIYDMSRKLEIIPEDIPVFLKGFILSLSSGVDLFFMISGYLITVSLIRHANIKNFLLDRMVRIYPVFLFLHVMLFAVAPVIKYKWLAGISVSAWIANFFSNLFFLPGVFDVPLMQLNAWSLSYECAFYLFSAAIYFFWSRQRMVSLALLLLVMPALIFIYPRAIFFAVGSAVFFIFNRRLEWTHNIPALGAWAVVPFFAVVGFANVSGYYYTIWLAAPLGFLVFLDVTRQLNPLAAILKHRFTLFMGSISYSFYLWHAVVTFPLKAMVQKILVVKLGITGWSAVLLFGVVAFIITVPVSYISYVVLEQRVGKWLKHYISKNKKE